MLAMLAGCSADPSESQPIVRLGQSLAEYSTLDSLQRAHMRDSLRPEIDALFAAIGHPYPDDRDLMWWSTSMPVEVFQPAVDSVYPHLYNLEAQLGQMLRNAERDSLGLPELRFATIVWGKPQPIVRVDTVVLIALNHYLGPDYEGYSHWDAYRRADKRPQMLPYDLAAALAATQYPFEMNEPPTLLNWMLYEGALVEARMRLVENADLAVALGYTPAQLELLEDNSMAIWQEMAQRRLIYDTDPATIDRLLTAAPNTPLLGGKAPGRAGRFIGYRIVKEYLRRHPSTLPHLLSPEFYANPQTLIKSGF